MNPYGSIEVEAALAVAILADGPPVKVVGQFFHPYEKELPKCAKSLIQTPAKRFMVTEMLLNRPLAILIR